jgi:AcrR family transcriptional regulator
MPAPVVARMRCSRTKGAAMSEKRIEFVSAPPGVDARALRTRWLLAEALISLGAAGSVDDLAVGELAGEAGVSRSTFYQHFASKDDFMVRSFVDMLGAMDAAERLHFPERGAVLPAQPLFHHVAAAGDFARSVARSEVWPRQLAAGETKLRDIADANLRRKMTHWRDDERREAAVFIAAGLIGLLRGWVENGLKQPPERMQAAFERLSAKVLSELGGAAG